MMATRIGNKDNRVYEAVGDIAYLDVIILSIMHTIGMGEDELYTATIDEIILNIRSTFEYSKNTLPTASQNTVRSISTLLVLNLRRAWFDRQIALEVMARG
jgi:hypothetical protein